MALTINKQLENTSTSFLKNLQKRYENRKQNNNEVLSNQFQSPANRQNKTPDSLTNSGDYQGSFLMQQNQLQKYQSRITNSSQKKRSIYQEGGGGSGLTGGGFSNQLTTNQIPYVSDKESQSYL